MEYLYTLNIGGTAIGTGICADERFASCAIKHMSEVRSHGPCLPFSSPNILQMVCCMVTCSSCAQFPTPYTSFTLWEWVMLATPSYDGIEEC